MCINSNSLDIMISLIGLKEDLVCFPSWHASQMRSFSNFKYGIPFTDPLELILDRWSKDTWPNLLFHSQEFSLKAFKHLALKSRFNISIIYTLFSRNLEKMQASILQSKTLQEESSKITLKPQSHS